MYNYNKSIFKEYDIRGVVERDFAKRLIVDLGRAFVRYISEASNSSSNIRVGIGRDARSSGPMLFEWLVEGIRASGGQVIDFGMCPTPLVYYSMFHLGLTGAIMITGSHNPPEYNGFKLCFGSGTLHGKDIQQLRQLIDEQKFISGTGSLESYDIVKAYTDYQLKRHKALAELEYKPKVVIDAGNGTAGIVAPEIFRRLGCEVVELFCEPDGTFPNHHPDPTVEGNLEHLKRAVKEHKANVGFAFDGDSDRIGIIDDLGQVLWGDEIMIILARDVLKRNPGATIIGEVKCSTRMYDEIKKAGGNAVMWKTGHSLIKARMKELKAILAGEMSGHIFFAEDYFGYDDAVHAALEVARILGEQMPEKKLSDFLADVPEVCVTPEIRIECDEDIKFKLVEKVVDLITEHSTSGQNPPVKELNKIDGIRVEFDHGWGLVRASNTQSILVSRFEATDEQNLKRYQNFVEEKIARARREL